MANSFFRKKKWKNLLHLDEVPEQGYYDNSIDNKWKKEELWNAVAKLPSSQRKVLTLRIARELKYKEIAQILKISENSAKVNYHYAIKTLKGRLS